MSSPHWFYHHLQNHFSSHQLKQAETFLYAESWISPSAYHRQWSQLQQSVPLRYQLNIDVNEQS